MSEGDTNELDLSAIELNAVQMAEYTKLPEATIQRYCDRKLIKSRRTQGNKGHYRIPITEAKRVLAVHKKERQMTGRIGGEASVSRMATRMNVVESRLDQMEENFTDLTNVIAKIITSMEATNESIDRTNKMIDDLTAPSASEPETGSDTSEKALVGIGG